MNTIGRSAAGCIFALSLAAAISVALPAAAQWRGGTVSLDAFEAARGAKSPVTVNLTVSSSAVGLRRVYVTVRCTELVDASHHVPEEKDDKGKLLYPSKSIKFTKNEVLFEKQFTIAGGQDLAAKSHHNFKGEIELPANLPPSFKGKYARIKWEASASADTTAWLDPGTSWQEVTVK